MWVGNWESGWSSIVPFTLGDKPYLLSYKTGDGVVAMDKINAEGMSVTESYKETVPLSDGEPKKQCEPTKKVRSKVSSAEMGSCVTLYETGQVDTEINIKVNNLALGFKGGFAAFFISDNGTVIDSV